jgi:hypothetical protein
MTQGLTNSRRMLLQATHTPIASTPGERDGIRALERRSVVKSLRLRPEHLESIAASHLLPDHQLAALRELSEGSLDDLHREIELAAALPPEQLVAIVDHLEANAGEGTPLEGTLDMHGLVALRVALRAVAQIEPVGYLHLEKLAFTPFSTEQGELVHSVPLAPKEVSSFTHREWSNVSEEFERLETDLLEEFSEQGVVEKNELQDSTENQYQHSTELSAGVNISGQYGTVKFAANAAGSVSDSTSRSDQFSRNTSNTVTRKASRRSVKEHTMSFRTVRASGTEDSSLKRIENPNPYPIRVDYYRMMRKWSVDLLRYGIRLTYDIVVPEPGADLLAQIKEMQEIQRLLTIGFGDPGGPDWAKFPLKPSDLTAANFATEAATYGAVVEAPPEDTKSISVTNTHAFGSFEESQHGLSASVVLDVDPAYDVQAAKGTSPGFEWPGWQTQFDRDRWVVNDTHASLYTVGRSGKVAVPYSVRYAASYSVTVTLDLKLTASAFVAWQGKAWAAIHDAAERRYFQQRASLQQRLADLVKLLGQNDTLTLRRMEREEVMKAALRWLIGPTFAPVSPITKYYKEDTGGIVDDLTWTQGTARGNLIRFLQQAIEWENVLYLMYPYFWSGAAGIEVRKYLDHPDPTHRAFLRSGAARVVLTIRPGFEKDFVDFIAGDNPGVSSKYLTIAEEMQAFASTNYSGIRPANAVEDPRPLLTYGQRKTWEKIQAIQHLLALYRTAKGGYPTTQEGLKSLRQTAVDNGLVFDMTDFWNVDLRYASPGLYDDYDLHSLGDDKHTGGEGEGADITSWAEASLVAQWFEYTPTGALDIEMVKREPAAEVGEDRNGHNAEQGNAHAPVNR